MRADHSQPPTDPSEEEDFFARPVVRMEPRVNGTPVPQDLFSPPAVVPQRAHSAASIARRGRFSYEPIGESSSFGWREQFEVVDLGAPGSSEARDNGVDGRPRAFGANFAAEFGGRSGSTASAARSTRGGPKRGQLAAIREDAPAARQPAGPRGSNRDLRLRPASGPPPPHSPVRLQAFRRLSPGLGMIAVERVAPPAFSAGPPTVRDLEALVVAGGRGRVEASGALQPPLYRVGDRVVLPRTPGILYTEGGRDFELFHEAEIIAKIE
ncbi:10 kDa chaperonin [Aphelenchoides fujianensis]|nr:10 kDa chaperonin [Aphelenchoides fujianensis]